MTFLKMNAKKLTTTQLSEGLNILEKGIGKLTSILEGNSATCFSVDEYIMMYTLIYNLCNQRPPHDCCEKLYNKYRETFNEYITSTVLPFLKEKNDEFMLKELVQRWENHKLMVRWLSRFFIYLDRFFVARRSITTLSKVGLSSFCDLAFHEVKGKVTNVVINLIDQEREGGQIDRSLLKNVLDIFVDIGIDIYEDDFEAPMLKDTAEYYSRKASNWIAEDSCPHYMIKAEGCLRREKDRASHYLHSISETRLLQEVRNELLMVHANQLFEKEDSGCLPLLRDNKVEDLSRMYRLFSKTSDGLELIATIFKQYVTDEGMVLVRQAEEHASNKAESAVGGYKEQVFVKKVIELRDKSMIYVTDCYSNDALFHKAVKEAFEDFCNKTVMGMSSAELLALHSDNILKKGGNEKLSDEEVEETLEKIVNVLVYISDKDLFAEFFRKKLSRRLLFEKYANDDHERFILSKLKQQFGAQLTSKMEGMVTDITLGKENQKHFQEYLNGNPAIHPGIDFTATILSTGFWPIYKSSGLCLPAEMVKCVTVFKEFYKTKTKHRILTWIYSLGTCNLNGLFDSKSIELIVGTYQAAVLLLFNSADRLSYSDINTLLNLCDDDLIRVLQSLSCAKYKVLTKEPNTRTVSRTDHFEFNRKFSDRMRRIRIPLPPQVDERKMVADDIEKDRRHAIDASIVRVMKSRKVVGHQQLVLECIEQLGHRFKPDIKSIKKRIGELIARDYMERDKDNSSVYKYLA